MKLLQRKERVVKSHPDWRRNSQVKKLKIIMRVILVALCLSVAAAGILTWLQVHHRIADAGRAVSSVSPSSGSSGNPAYADSFGLILANSSTHLPSGYQPQLSEYRGISADRRIIPALREMMDAAAAAGAPLTLESGYVSPQGQDAVYQAEVKRLMASDGLSRILAENKAQGTVGRGGYNEGQTGLSVVFGAEGQKDSDFSSTAQYRWLIAHSVSYGFVLRFPQSKTEITGRNFQPGRFRYVGKDNAVQMQKLSLCLEEYVSYLAKREQN